MTRGLVTMAAIRASSSRCPDRDRDGRRSAARSRRRRSRSNRPGLAMRRFGQHGCGALDVTDQRVGDDCIDSSAQDRGCGSHRRGSRCDRPGSHRPRTSWPRRSKGALVDARDVPRTRPAGNVARYDTGAAAKIDDRVGVIDAHHVEVLVQHAHENGCRPRTSRRVTIVSRTPIVQLVRHAIRVDARHSYLRRQAPDQRRYAVAHAASGIDRNWITRWISAPVSSVPGRDSAYIDSILGVIT